MIDFHLLIGNDQINTTKAVKSKFIRRLRMPAAVYGGWKKEARAVQNEV